MTHASRVLQSRDLSGEGICLDHIRTFLTTQGHRGPPRMSDQLNGEATSEITRTIHSLMHMQGGYDKDDYHVQMIFGEQLGPIAS